MSVMRNPGPLRDSLKLFAQAGGLWLERDAFVHAGSLAFYTLFSMAPVVIIAVSIAGTVFGQEAARGEIVSRFGDFVGPEAAHALEDAVVRWRPSAGGLFPALTGLLAMTIGATTVFAQMQISLNRIWGVVTKPHKSVLVIIVKNRVVSLAIVITIGFIMLVSLLVDVALTARRLVQRTHNGRALHVRTSSHQRVSGVPCTRFDLRSRRIAGPDPAVGLLLGVGSLLGSGADQGERAGVG
jgi:uncharacterized BrkB/YihY/UPF0761 family membrane protein